ncbi:MAG: hypothetical protein JWL77_4918 [Chthonomonadaceae bacterium]|nr:hypothetical protein [Chthonomonadaceae bacterium]
MNRQNKARRACIALACAALLGMGASRLSALRQTPEGISLPVAIHLSTAPPENAILLFTGKPEQITSNFYKRYSKDPAGWTVDAQGAATPNHTDITSKQEFGDSFVHCDFRIALDAGGKAIGHGNSGVGLQGRYEIQIFNSYGEKSIPTGCGALYNQKAALVTASKKAGEWQTFDIIFRAPRFGADGKVAEQPRVTVFQNGILVQNNNDFLGMTGIQYGEYKEAVKTGPIILQGDHDVVQFRNVWVAPLQ